MRWQDEGIVVWRSPFGEGSMMAGFLTREHGLHAGLLRCGGSLPRGDLQTGNLLDVVWSARLSEHLGRYRGQLRRAYASFILQSGRGRLLALASVCALLRLCLPERQSMPRLFSNTEALLQSLTAEQNGDGWVCDYCRWELALLEELGYGLDLASCALGGNVADLAYISPKSGRAASYQKARDYENKLLKLPSFLRISGDAIYPSNIVSSELHAALQLSGFFLCKRILKPFNKALPNERIRLQNLFGEALDNHSESF